MKRILICILALMLILPFSGALAEDNPMQSLRLETEINGDELDARFYADMAYPSDTVSFESMDFVLTYAKDVLQLIEMVTDGNAPESDIIDSSFVSLESVDVAGRYEYHCASALGSKGSGLLLHLRFRIIGEGTYNIRLQKDGFSVYEIAEDRSTSYRFPLLKTSYVAEETPVPEPETETPTAELSEKPDKGWFQKLIESIFGSSCRCG